MRKIKMTPDTCLISQLTWSHHKMIINDDDEHREDITNDVDTDMETELRLIWWPLYWRGLFDVTRRLWPHWLVPVLVPHCSMLIGLLSCNVLSECYPQWAWYTLDTGHMSWLVWVSIWLLGLIWCREIYFVPISNTH